MRHDLNGINEVVGTLGGLEGRFPSKTAWPPKPVTNDVTQKTGEGKTAAGFCRSAAASLSLLLSGTFLFLVTTYFLLLNVPSHARECFYLPVIQLIAYSRSSYPSPSSSSSPLLLPSSSSSSLSSHLAGGSCTFRLFPSAGCMMRPKPASSLQKTYDDCYLMCSTAVYFEGQVRDYSMLPSTASPHSSFAFSQTPLSLPH